MEATREWTNFIEELKNKNDIVDVINSYTPLEQKGKTFWGRCPFHSEKTPSFAVNKVGQFYHCFGCNKSGDVIKFVQELESLEFMDSVEFLAKRVGLDVPNKSFDKDIIEKKKKKQIHYEICKHTARFYNSVLLSDKGKLAYNYLEQRGIERSTIIKFGLGYSPNWTDLVDYLVKLGYSKEQCKESGVIDEKNNRYYDFLAERVIVPIFNQIGDVIAFGGRTLEKNPKFAKYKNTSETFIFSKSNTVYGLNFVKKAKQLDKIDSLIIVEGYMDVLSMVQAGYNNVVASMGTSLTKEQAILIKRFVDTVYVCFDGDSAGLGATIRGLDIFRDTGIDIKVMTLPDGMDPDDIIKKFGKTKFDNLIKFALPLVDYKLSLLLKIYDINNEDSILKEEAKRNYTSRALNVINLLNDNVEKESYLALLSKQTGFSQDFLKREIDRFSFTENAKTKKTDELETVIDSADEKAIYFITACLLFKKEFAVLDFDLMSNNIVIMSALKYIKESKTNNKEIMPSMLYQLVDLENSGTVDKLLNTKFSTTIEDSKYFVDCVDRIRSKQYSEELSKLNQLYGDEPDLEKKKDILKKISTINLLLKKTV